MKIGLRAIAAMKTYGLMAAGFALVGMMVGAFTAGPAIAQAVRAALVSNVDDPGRIPYQLGLDFLACNPGNCNVQFPPVPPGKRLVITNISGSIATSVAAGSLVLPSVDANNAGKVVIVFLSTTFQGVIEGQNLFVFNQPTHLFYAAGEQPFAEVQFSALNIPGAGTVTFTLTGYMVDCSTGPCAAIAP
jgi:hypothetical protein